MTATTDHHLVVDADLLAIRDIGPFLTKVIAPLDVEDAADLVGSMELALQELAVNIVEHAYDDQNGTLSLNWSLNGRLATVEVRDQGPPFDWEQASRADLAVPQVNGYGLIIIETITEEFSHHRDGDDNVWTLVFDLDR